MILLSAVIALIFALFHQYIISAVILVLIVIDDFIEGGLLC